MPGLAASPEGLPRRSSGSERRKVIKEFVEEVVVKKVGAKEFGEEVSVKGAPVRELVEKGKAGELAKKVVAGKAAVKGFIKEVVAGQVSAEGIDEEVAVKTEGIRCFNCQGMGHVARDCIKSSARGLGRK